MRRWRWPSRQEILKRTLACSAALAAIYALDAVLAGNLVINVTASIPRGLYWSQEREHYRPGQLVSYQLPKQAQRLAVMRGYMTSMSTTTLKTIAAAGGDHVCISDTVFTINGATKGFVKQLDTVGRRLPHSTLCRTLGADEVFLMNDGPWSFDSRYYGAVPSSRILGSLATLITE